MDGLQDFGADGLAAASWGGHGGAPGAGCAPTFPHTSAALKDGAFCALYRGGGGCSGGGESDGTTLALGPHGSPALAAADKARPARRRRGARAMELAADGRGSAPRAPPFDGRQPKAPSASPLSASSARPPSPVGAPWWGAAPVAHSPTRPSPVTPPSAPPGGGSGAVDLATVYAFVGSLLDPACDGVDHVGALAQMPPCDRAVTLSCLRNLAASLGDPETAARAGEALEAARGADAAGGRWA